MEPPEIVVHGIPRIEVFQVSDHELDRIEEYGKHLADEYAFMLSAGSICVTLLVAVGTAKFGPVGKAVVMLSIATTAIATLVLGIRWFRNRSNVSDVIDQIRARRVDPQSEPPTPGNILT